MSKTYIKKAMIKGAVWLSRAAKKPHRLRRATSRVRPGDRLVFYYNSEILMQKAPQAQCLNDFKRYSIWYKPAGLMTQGTRYGDHVSLCRQVEQRFKQKRKVYLVHRLDRETIGVCILAHDHNAATLFSDLFRKHHIEKHYRAWVLGHLITEKTYDLIDLPLDGKTAQTQFRSLRYDSHRNQTLIDVKILTGRYHQIRRHLDMLGHPVMGDPRYGRKNKTASGLRLMAYCLYFKCPYRHDYFKAKIDPKSLGFA
jgi:tRNA pseudouridine32 synthase/23S rRNA pseudouridine746 synthase